MLCHNIHGYLAQIQIGTNAAGCRDTGILKDIVYHLRRKLPCRHVISAKIVCHIHKNLIYRVNTDILRCDILKINIVYACTVIHIQSHTRRCNNVCQLILRMCVKQLRII